MDSSFSGTSSSEFQTLAELRLADAQALLRAGRYDAAYYLGGYAVECALKAIITQEVLAAVLPARGAVEKVYTHDLLTLLRRAGLDTKLIVESNERPGLRASWAVVEQWDESRRYITGVDEKRAADFLKAIEGEDGVLTWLRRSW